MIEIIDNYLPEDLYRKTKDVLEGNTFPWFYCDSVLDPTDPQSKSGDVTSYQMTHTFYYRWEWTSQFAPLVMPILEYMDVFQPVRVKANLTFKAEENYETGWHIDFNLNNKPQKCKTALLYFSTTNGPTLFKTGESADCVENRLVVFDNTPEYSHTGTMATDKLRRIVLNFNWIDY